MVLLQQKKNSQPHYISHIQDTRHTHSRVALLKESMSGCRSSDAVDPLTLGLGLA